MNMNKVMMMGRFTDDPKLESTPKGTNYVKYTVAINRKYKGKDEVEYIDVTTWGKDAETIAAYMKKGSPIFLEGRLKKDTWAGKAKCTKCGEDIPQKREKLFVVSTAWQFIQKKDREIQEAVPDNEF